MTLDTENALTPDTPTHIRQISQLEIDTSFTDDA
jgi:hypothetical protein